MINLLWCLYWLLYTDFIKDILSSELVLGTDKVLIVGDFNIHVDKDKGINYRT